MKKIVRLTERDLTNLVKRIISEKKGKKSKEESFDDDEFVSILDRCIEDTPKEDFDDVEDWVEEVFSSCESEFGDDMTEEDLENFKDEYYDYVMDCWEEGNNNDDFSDDDDEDFDDEDDYSDDDDEDFDDEDEDFDDEDEDFDDEDEDFDDEDEDFDDEDEDFDDEDDYSDDDDDYSDDDDDYSDDDDEDFGTMRGRFFDKDDDDDF